MKKLLPLFLLTFPWACLYGQKSGVTDLFTEEKPLNLKLNFGIKEIKKKTNDSVYLPGMLYVQQPDASWDSLKVDLRARGIFRRKNCFFPPVRIKMGKSDTKNSVFAGNKSLKLVLPCETGGDKNTLIVKEYIAYQLYEQISPYYFNTRLVNVDFGDVDGKKIKRYQLTGFLIEDDDLVAKRHKAKIVENRKLHPRGLNDTLALRHDLFQFMISNIDWSTTFEHNSKLMFKEPSTYIPLAYDFDMSGLVDAPYGRGDENAVAGGERVYRGFCRNENVTQAVRQEFVDKESVMMGIVDGFQAVLSPGDIKIMKRYLGEFFSIMKDPNLFKANITDKCRTKS
ncbi:MAG TPA: hypothetical protein VG737_08285 [Cyclobacteriaceae bacterium]|nr:hypothetical protein [Cyclobacteriaceae bacterium]